MAVAVSELLADTESLLDRKFKNAVPAAHLKSQFLRYVGHTYKFIADMVREPRTSTTKNSVAGNNYIELPSDVWDHVDGILGIDYDGFPLVCREYEENLRSKYEDEWLNPADLERPTYWLRGYETAKVMLIPAPTASKVCTIYYVQEVPKPTEYTDNVPRVYEPFTHIMPLYILGRAMEGDRQGRGASLIAEFEARLKRRDIRKARRGRRNLGEAYTLGMKEYKAAFGRGRRRR